MNIFRKNFRCDIYFESGYKRIHFFMARSRFLAISIAFRAFPSAIQVNAKVCE